MKQKLLFIVCFVSVLSYAQTTEKIKSPKSSSSTTDSTAYIPKPFIGVDAGTLGFGMHFSYPLSKRWDVRLNGSYFSTQLKSSSKMSTNDVSRTDSLTIGGAGLIFDYSLFKKRPGIKLAIGGIYNFGRVSSNQQVTAYMDDTEPRDAGAVWLQLTPNKLNPYAGLVFGNYKTKKRLIFAFELGTLFMGKPKATFIGSGQLEPMSEQEEIVQSNANTYQWYPMINMSISFKLGKL